MRTDCNSRRLLVVFTMLALMSGCKDESAVLPPGESVPRQTNEVSLVEPEAIPPASVQEPKQEDQPSALQRARDLFRQSDDKGSTENVKKWLGDRLKDAAGSSEDAAASSMDWANKTYEMLKDQGLTTADSAQQWLKDDFQSIGDWEYKIVKLNVDDKSSGKTEKTLNELGSERWECFQITRGGASNSQYFYHFKRQKRSYLKSLPVSDLMRLVPLMSSDGQ